MARQLIAELEAHDLVPYFRVGQSMHHIIFSTADSHGLGGEPRVTLEILPREQQVRVAYSLANMEMRPAISESHLAATEGVANVLHLRRLWLETKRTPLPPGLTAT
jgi:hypothetical protein